MNSKHCNKCGFVGALELFTMGDGYAYGRRPYCKECHNKDLRERRKLKHTPRKKITRDFNIDESLDILIQNGYARNREEAKRYLQC